MRSAKVPPLTPFCTPYECLPLPHSPTHRLLIRRIARPPTPQLCSRFDSRATHARTLLPGELSSLPFGFVLVRVRLHGRAADAKKPRGLELIACHMTSRFRAAVSWFALMYRGGCASVWRRSAPKSYNTNENPAKDFRCGGIFVCVSVVQCEMARWTLQHEQHECKFFIRKGNNGRCFGVSCAVTD
jgi:hypothetical protein